MLFLFKLIGMAIVLAFLAVAAFTVDLFWNDGRLAYRWLGRDRMISDCRPIALETLIGKGYSPVDLAFGAHPSISLRSGFFGRERTITDAITFSDGVDGPELEGTMSCRLAGHAIRVDIEVRDLPHRSA